MFNIASLKLDILRGIKLGVCGGRCSKFELSGVDKTNAYFAPQCWWEKVHWRNVPTAARSTKQTPTLKLMLMQLKLKTSFYDATNLHWWFTLATKFWVESYLKIYLCCWGNLNHKKSAFKIKDFHGTFESICNVLHFQKYNLTRLKKQTD